MEIPTSKYLNLKPSDLKIGDMFFVTIDNIGGLVLNPEIEVNCDSDKIFWKYDEELENFQHDFYSCDDFETIGEDASMQTIRNNSITLVKYLGNSKFLEYYAGITINYVDFGNEDGYTNFNNFENDYNDYIKNPLYIEYGMLLPVDNINFRRQFVRQKEQSNAIKNVIYAMHNECIDGLREGLEKIKEQDWIFADIENEAEDMIRTFAKTEPRR